MEKEPKLFHQSFRSMHYSCKLSIREERVDPDGNSPLHFQVIINRKKAVFAVEAKWSKGSFDKKAGAILPRQKNDAEFNLMDSIITREKEKITSIFRRYLLADKQLTVEILKKEMKEYDSTQSLAQFIKTEAKERYKRSEISEQTYKNNLSTAELLKHYPDILLGTISKRTLVDLENWMRQKKNYAHNTIAGRMKEVITYLQEAKRQRLVFEDDIFEYKKPRFKDRIVFLNETELTSLRTMYASGELPDHLDATLGAFLFACFTGLRVSDWNNIRWEQLDNGWLELMPYKTRKYSKTIRIYLPEAAYQFLKTKRGKLLKNKTSQTFNKNLKVIADRAGIHKPITSHYARHTFATRFLRKGGKVEELQRALGHAKIEQTMKYVHVEDEQMILKMSNLD